MSFSITVPPCLRPLRVNTPLSSVMLAREPQRLHCHMPSGLGRRFMRSAISCRQLGTNGGTTFSMLGTFFRWGPRQGETVFGNNAKGIRGSPRCPGVFGAQGVALNFSVKSLSILSQAPAMKRWVLPSRDLRCCSFQHSSTALRADDLACTVGSEALK